MTIRRLTLSGRAKNGVEVLVRWNSIELIIYDFLDIVRILEIHEISGDREGPGDREDPGVDE